MPKKRKEIQIEVIYTEGYEQRFTRAICEMHAARKAREAREAMEAEEKVKQMA